MVDIQQDYLKLSKAVYGVQPDGDHYRDKPDTWVQLPVNNNLVHTQPQGQGQYYICASGLEAAVYGHKVFDSNGNFTYDKYTIAYRGTDSLLDQIGADGLGVVLGLINPQKGDAEKFYNAVIQEYGSNVTLTGHSLGGALAQIVATENGVTAYTYNAPGVTATGDSSKITNYVVMNDFVGNLNTHLGTTYYIAPIPIDEDPLKDAHNGILNYTEANNGSIFSLSGFTQQEADSLWYYDVNNNYSSNLLLDAIRGHISLQASEADLQNAVAILRTLDVPKQTLHYCISSGDIIIDSTQNDVLQGTEASLVSVGSDTIYGNAGVDVIMSYSGNDKIFGGTGNDSLVGGTGNDNYYFYTGDGNNDEIQDTDEVFAVVNGSIPVSMKKGSVYINDQIIYGGQYNETFGKYVDYTNAGVTYTWNGINGTALKKAA